MTTVTPSDGQILDDAMDARLLDLWTCLPGYVAKVYTDRGHQYVDVTPALRRPIRNEDGTLAPEDLPVIPCVPVAFPQGGGFFVSFPLKPGDVVTVVFAQWSIDQWIAQGTRGASAPVTAADVGTHRMDGAIALPCGPMPTASLLQGVSPEKLVIANEGGVKIEMGGGTVTVSDGGDAVAVNSKVQAELNRIKSELAAFRAAFMAHVHPTGVGPSGVTTTPLAAPATPGVTGSTVVLIPSSAA